MPDKFDLVSKLSMDGDDRLVCKIPITEDEMPHEECAKTVRASETPRD